MDEHERQRRFDRPRPVAATEPAQESGPTSHECVELCPICRSADVLRASLPPEFHDHWQTVQREAVLALRAALDHYIDHLDRSPGKDNGPSVEDIPIE